MNIRSIISNYEQAIKLEGEGKLDDAYGILSQLALDAECPKPFLMTIEKAISRIEQTLQPPPEVPEEEEIPQAIIQECEWNDETDSLDVYSIRAIPSIEGKMPIKPKEYERLKRDIYERGIQVPLIVTPDHRLLCGYNRWKIAKELGMHNVPVNIKKIHDSKLYEFAIKDNIMRRQLSLDEIAAYMEQESVQGQGRPKKNSQKKTNTDLAKTFGVSETTVSRAKKFAKKVKDTPALKGSSIRTVLDGNEPVIKKMLKFEVTIGIDEERLMKEVENIVDEIYNFNSSNGDKVKAVVQLYLIKRK